MWGVGCGVQESQSWTSAEISTRDKCRKKHPVFAGTKMCAETKRVRNRSGMKTEKSKDVARRNATNLKAVTSHSIALHLEGGCVCSHGQC